MFIRPNIKQPYQKCRHDDITKTPLKKKLFIFLFIILATSKTWTWTLDPHLEKSGPRKTWTLKNMDPEKHGMNMGLKYVTFFTTFYKDYRNVICCLKLRLLTDI